MEPPELWWSPTAGLIRGATNGGHEDAVPLVPAEPLDEKGRGPSYWRGHRDGRMAERAGIGRDEVLVSGMYCGPAVMPGPPFAPELADAPIVSGESGALAPMVVDHPVHESTLPDELYRGDSNFPGDRANPQPEPGEDT